MTTARLYEPRTPTKLPPTTLTARQREHVALAAEGWTNAAIAERTGAARKTVETHLVNAADKLGLGGDPERHTRVLLARWWWAREAAV